LFNVGFRHLSLELNKLSDDFDVWPKRRSIGLLISYQYLILLFPVFHHHNWNMGWLNEFFRDTWQKKCLKPCLNAENFLLLTVMFLHYYIYQNIAFYSCKNQISPWPIFIKIAICAIYKKHRRMLYNTELTENIHIWEIL
jgi:hypothetical protein